MVNPIRRADPAQRATLVAEVRRDAGDEGTSEALEQQQGSIFQALTGALNGGDELFLGYSYGTLRVQFCSVRCPMAEGGLCPNRE